MIDCTSNAGSALGFATFIMLIVLFRISRLRYQE
jgi:hypothetical protein